MWNVKNTYKTKHVREYYTIGEIKEMYGIGADSLRYYERKGLLNPKRGENQYRYYSGLELLRLNIIKSLRDIDLPLEQIGEFMNNRTIASTLDLLHGVLGLMNERIRLAEQFVESVQEQINEIQTANSFLFDVVSVSKLPARPAFLLEESYVTTHEYSIIRNELTRSNDLPFSVIGDNRVGSAISLQRIEEGDFTTYDCMFALDRNGTFSIPAGIYLTVRYRGAVQSEKYIRMLMNYAQLNGFRIIGPYLEWCLLDIHTTDLQSEAVMENQVLVELA